ncbi:vesicle transport v-snare protein vti1 [Pluteus cervinus]|uniref:Vesicle transport v-snare protein vti1 n=1 Tax=Pluteus cervinus TaxID=181527 RepID=A0ACD3BED1_9AGAR|nr:vesicle transport v-snare protein vti1 [Pluteus cervinus]
MDTSPTALFESYEQDFQQFIETIKDKLEGEGKDETGGNFLEQRKGTLRRVEMDLDEADEMVSQMEIEIQGIPQSLRSKYQTRLRTAKADLTRYKKLLKEVQALNIRSDLLSSRNAAGVFPPSDEPYGANSDRARLLSGTSLLEDGTKRLQESQRLALETENQGADILTSLRGQREQIEHARGTLQTAEISIERATGTLKRMIVRMYQQRAVTAAIIAVLVLLIIVIVWEKLS